jgi:uncharacterized protein (DUF983 family)
MAETEKIEVGSTKKPEGSVDKAKTKKDQAAPGEGEVEGRGVGRWVRCWHCGSMRHVYQDYRRQVFICGNCGYEYIPD